MGLRSAAETAWGQLPTCGSDGPRPGAHGRTRHRSAALGAFALSVAHHDERPDARQDEHQGQRVGGDLPQGLHSPLHEPNAGGVRAPSRAPSQGRSRRCAARRQRGRQGPGLDRVAFVEATWLVHRIKFVNAWVARHQHFGNITTSRAEGTHSTLKSMLHTRPAQRRPGQGRP